MRKKRVLGVIGVGLCLLLVGCGSGKKFSEDNFALTTDKGEDGKYLVAIYIDKDMVSVDYELSENGVVKQSGEYEENADGLLKENVLSNKTPGKYDYSLIVKNKDGDELSKSVTVTVDESDNIDTEDTTTDNNEDSKSTDEEKTDDSEESKTDTSKEEPWSGDAVAYSTGQKVSFNGKSYSCLQGHTSQADWTPTGAASLWKEEKNN